MRAIHRTSQFKKDVKRMKRRNKGFAEFKKVIEALVHGQTLDERYRDHALIGQYKGTRECHIAPDWLLIYEISANELILVRTGTHADLFGK